MEITIVSSLDILHLGEKTHRVLGALGACRGKCRADLMVGYGAAGQPDEVWAAGEQGRILKMVTEDETIRWEEELF